MKRYADVERRSLADALEAAGPDAPTLCAGWTTRDLAAHVVVRERRPDAALGLVLPWLRGRGERVRAGRAAQPYPALVDEIRQPPWWSPVSNPLLDGVLNATELFIHHEDVRRGAPGWAPRDLPAAYEAALWGRVRTLSRWHLRRWRASVLLDAPGYGQCRAGTGGDRIRVVGAPAELLLFLSGRQRATRTTVSGPPELARRLRDARLGV
ncbi:TIGR03085 family protein [Pilimelia anulata]|uniref:TIGR03085 family protein n=1 Tax=Pilimelia anulata TaxID=53371 RepID=A0A8J3B7F5_9ACTN|nr:TIGR03085 family metal-binding protein [Pilimelia anulata]GGJ80203.1 TIGR03085 family protein [Pilimelia anulata]